jgi:hypothetical protein
MRRVPKVDPVEEPPEPTMPTPAPLDEGDGHVNEVPVRPRLQRRRRMMGDAIRQAGRVKPGAVDPDKATAERSHVELRRVYTTGGVSKGEQAGFGVAFYREKD